MQIRCEIVREAATPEKRQTQAPTLFARECALGWYVSKVLRKHRELYYYETVIIGGTRSVGSIDIVHRDAILYGVARADEILRTFFGEEK